MCLVLCFFFVKQKTAYEVRISGWGSDVCSSDLSAAIRNLRDSQYASSSLPDFPIWTDCLLEGPGGLRLVEKIPIGVGDRVRRHQPVGIEIVERFAAFALRDDVAHEGGIDAGIDDEMRDMDLLRPQFARHRLRDRAERSEEHTSELQSLMRISYAVFCLKK